MNEPTNAHPQNAPTPETDAIIVRADGNLFARLCRKLERERDEWKRRAEEAKADKSSAYLERNRLVALLASMYPSGISRTNIDGWSDDWCGCVYIDFPWGQASWHYHDSHTHLFSHLPSYNKSWDGHTTEQKYRAIDAAMKGKGII